MHASTAAQLTVTNTHQLAVFSGTPVVCDDQTILQDQIDAFNLQIGGSNSAGLLAINQRFIAANLLATETVNFNQKHNWTESDPAMVIVIANRDAAMVIVNTKCAAALESNYVAYAAALLSVVDAQAVSIVRSYPFD